MLKKTASIRPQVALELQLSDTENEILNFYSDDNPREVVEQFCIEKGLSEDIMELIYDQLVQEINALDPFNSRNLNTEYSKKQYESFISENMSNKINEKSLDNSSTKKPMVSSDIYQDLLQREKSMFSQSKSDHSNNKEALGLYKISEEHNSLKQSLKNNVQDVYESLMQEKQLQVQKHTNKKNSANIDSTRKLKDSTSEYDNNLKKNVDQINLPESMAFDSKSNSSNLSTGRNKSKIRRKNTFSMGDSRMMDQMNKAKFEHKNIIEKNNKKFLRKNTDVMSHSRPKSLTKSEINIGEIILSESADSFRAKDKNNSYTKSPVLRSYRNKNNSISAIKHANYSGNKYKTQDLTIDEYNNLQDADFDKKIKEFKEPSRKSSNNKNLKKQNSVAYSNKQKNQTHNQNFANSVYNKQQSLAGSTVNQIKAHKDCQNPETAIAYEIWSQVIQENPNLANNYNDKCSVHHSNLFKSDINQGNFYK